MSNILVTGGAGFIGSHVTKQLLNQGHKVSILDNFSTSNNKNIESEIKVIKGDIQEESVCIKALVGIDAVIHMAGLISVTESVEDPIKYANNNLVGTIELLEAMRKTNVNRIIFSSSATVYGNPEKLPIEEDAPIKPFNPYGASKAAVETFLQAYHANFNFNVGILRYFNPYGPGENHIPETHAIPNFIKAILNKEPIPLFWKGEQVRDFIYVEDLAKAHSAILEKEGFNIYNVGTQNGVKVIDVVNHLFDIMDYKVEIKDLGKREGDVQANYASSKKLMTETSWRAEVDLTEGLTRTVDYFKKNKNR